MANATLAGTTPLLVSLSRSRAAVCSFAHLCIYMPGRVVYRARPALKPARRLQRFIIGPANRASRLYSRPARFKTGRPAIKPAAGFQAGQVYNRALTYIYTYTTVMKSHCTKHRWYTVISLLFVVEIFSDGTR